MPTIPRDILPDITLPLLADPYRFISRRARHHRSEIFRSRLLGQRAVFLSGPGAAKFFYAPGRFSRNAAIPERIAHVLFGDGGVQRLDGALHRQRKALWLDLMTGHALDDLDRAVDSAFEESLPDFVAIGSIDVFPQASRILAKGVCDWAGVSLAPTQVTETSEMLASLFLDASRFGPAHWRGRLARKHADAWAADLIQSARRRGVDTERNVVAEIAGWKDAEGEPLPLAVAATELLNALRPTVAVAVYVTFIAMALHRHPGYRQPVAQDDRMREAFVQEVRRLYPFFPSIAARAAADCDWNGEAIAPGTRAVLDLYGTGRDPEAWEAPESFRPERFLDWPGDPWTLIPQGGGDHAVTHRCPGERSTIRLMQLFARRLAMSDYEVATPAARPDYRSTPALPRDGFRLQNFRPQ